MLNLSSLASPCLGPVMASGGGWQKEVTLGLQASLGQRDLKLGCSSGTRCLAAGMRHPQDKAEATLSCYSTVCRGVKRPAYHSMPPSVYLSGLSARGPDAPGT